ncbi:MAG: MFS transporter [Deltaproteobacteria bacterium]|jgi:sugar phosphate permease|nr:MFS transporter [Deltaproteobacteria bacterium]
MNQPETTAKPSRYRWVVFSLLAFGYLLVYFHRLCPAVVALDMQADLKTSGALLGFLAAAYFYPYALMQIPSGLLSDTWGPRKTITVFFALAGVASIFLGTVSSLGLAILARILVGLGVAMLFVPTMKVMTNWFKPEEFAVMTGVLMAVGGLGAYTAARPLAWLSDIMGWRGSFVIIGAVTLVLAVAVWILVRNTPQEKGLPAVNQPAADNPGRAKTITLGQGIKMVLSTGGFWFLAAWFFFSFSIFFSFGGLWGGPYLMQIYGYSKAEAGNILGMMALAMIVGSPIFGWLSDQVFRSRKKVLILASVITLFLTVPLAFFPAAMNRPTLYLLCFLFGLFNSAVVIVAFTAAKELFPVEIAGTSVGLANLFPFLGGAIAPPIVGAILEAQEKTAAGYSAHAYSRAFLLYFIFALIALVASCFLTETLKTNAD